MIIAGIQGRLGNELFQLSALYGQLSSRERLILVGPKVAVQSSSLVEGVIRLTVRRTTVIRLFFHLLRLAGRLRLIGRIEEGNSSPMPRVSRGLLPVRFSCESFFQDPQVVSGGPTVVLPDHLREQARGILRAGSGCVGVAVHVRRGDYLRWGPYGPAVLPWEYYEKAIVRIEALFEPGQPFRFVFLSDDLDYVRSRISDRSDCVAFESEELLALSVMAEADYVVLSASTFSWWGSELARRRNPSRVAMAPLYWAGWPGDVWYPTAFAGDRSLEWLPVSASADR